MEKEQDNQDQSMEEILQSIKRIIADDEEEENGADTTAIAPEVSEDGGTDSAEVKGSDVLELKELVEEGEPQDTASEADALSALLDGDKPVSAPKEAAASGDDDILASIDSLLTNEAAQASSSALQQLKEVNVPPAQPAPVRPIDQVNFRSGTTVEDLVVEALKPELKNWLNANLPQIVERLVKAEIKKISQ